jgi:hypothetical protein
MTMTLTYGGLSDAVGRLERLEPNPTCALPARFYVFMLTRSVAQGAVSRKSQLFIQS